MAYKDPPMKYKPGINKFDVDFDKPKPLKTPVSESQSLLNLGIVVAIILAGFILWYFFLT